ncbi:MAG: N4-gp56 family major capsid protein [Candidatus Paceibacterota bacterium]|jgi:N4-gp56 family major capsid protein
MAITITSTLGDSVAALYEKDFLEEKRKTSVWAQQGLVNWKYALGGANLKGSSINIPMIAEMAIATTALTETSDVTPVALEDYVCTVSFAEYGNVVQTTRMLDIENYADVGKQAAYAVGQNQSKSLDILVRDAAVGGTWVAYPIGVGTRTGLDTTNDLMTFADTMFWRGLIADSSIQGFGNDLAIIVHPAVLAGVASDSNFLTAKAYMDASAVFNGEVGKLGGFRFVSHEYGKLYLGGGSTDQAATTTSAAITAGATTVTLTDSTGIVAGEFLTVGTLEAATVEQVMVTGYSSGSTATIMGRGNSATNFGFKFAHDSGVAANAAPNVAGCVVAGRNSLFGAYAKDLGKDGQLSVEWAKTNIPQRFLNHSWYGIWGFGRNEHALLRIECAVPGGILGNNGVK